MGGRNIRAGHGWSEITGMRGYDCGLGGGTCALVGSGWVGGGTQGLLGHVSRVEGLGCRLRGVGRVLDGSVRGLWRDVCGRRSRSSLRRNTRHQGSFILDTMGGNLRLRGKALRLRRNIRVVAGNILLLCWNIPCLGGNIRLRCWNIRILRWNIRALWGSIRVVC